MKKSLKILLILFIMFYIFSLNVNAEVINVEEWTPSSTGSNEKLIGITGRILGVIQIVGSITSISVLIIIGMKYMFGSIEEKVQYRKTMAPYIIGCLIIFATSNIVSFIYNIANGLDSSSSSDSSTTTVSCDCSSIDRCETHGACRPYDPCRKCQSGECSYCRVTYGRGN